MPLFKPPTTEETRSYYRELRERKRNPLFWGIRRFDPEKGFNSPSLNTHFQRVINPLIHPGDRVLDLGCGSGMFLPAIYKQTRDIHAVDTSAALLGQAEGLVSAYGLEGIAGVEADAEKLPYGDAHFDTLVAVDVLHHFQRFNRCLKEMWRVVKPGGNLIILEPNKLNPLLALGCLLDRNEWGDRLFTAVSSVPFSTFGPCSPTASSLARIGNGSSAQPISSPDHPGLNFWVGWLLKSLFWPKNPILDQPDVPQIPLAGF